MERKRLKIVDIFGAYARRSQIKRIARKQVASIGKVIVKTIGNIPGQINAAADFF